MSFTMINCFSLYWIGCSIYRYLFRSKYSRTVIKMQEIKRKGWEYGKKQKIDYFYGQWGYHFR